MSKQDQRPQDECHIEQFPHTLPHHNAAQMRRCGHAACDPHTISYFGTGSDPELEGDYCLLCFGQQFDIWPDKVLLAVARDAQAPQI